MFIKFLNKLSYKAYLHNGNNEFLLTDLVDEIKIKDGYKEKIDDLINSGHFFLEKTENNKYIKTYRIPEICERTLKELEKEKINERIISELKAHPLLLHTEFVRWLNTKHRSMLSYILDKYWHNFMIYSYEYNSWCNDNYGYLIHHVPTPEYEKTDSTELSIIKDHVDFFYEYRKNYPITKTVLFYNLPYKLTTSGVDFKTVKKIIFDLIYDLKNKDKVNCNINVKKLSNISNKVIKSLKENNFHILKGVSLDEYHALNRLLGSVINNTNITIVKDSNRKFNSHRKMPLHTDSHDVDIVGWFCQRQDDLNGDIHLVDLKDIKSLFTTDEIKTLETIDIKYPIYKRFYTGLHPLLINNKIYYAPWLEAGNYSGNQSIVLEKFKTIIDEKKRIKVKLKKGDVLYVNNLHVLHGRDEISYNSKRLLYRVHIIK